MSAFDNFFNTLASAPKQASAPTDQKPAPESVVKIAFSSPEEEAMWGNLAGEGAAKQASSDGETVSAKDLFDDIFDLHTEKLAADNPEYNKVLNHLAVKSAFEAGYEDTIASAKAVGLVK